jgi:Mg2+ and Co2+ transporter CorA
VTIVDYSSDGQGTRVDVPGKKLKMWLNSPDGQRPVQPQPGTQGDDKEKLRSVRWINVDGINFEILKFLTLRYGLHPLAVEDTLRATNNPRSKLDFYANHLYLQILVQHIRPQDREDIKKTARLRGRGPNVTRTGHAAYGSTGEGSPLDSGDEDEDEDEDDETTVEGSTAETYQSSGQAESGTPKRRRITRKPRSGSSSSAKRAQDAVKAQTSGWGRFLRMGKGKEKTSLPEGVEGVFEPMQPMQTGHANTVSGSSRHRY